MNVSRCAAYAYLVQQGDGPVVECEREIHDDGSDHRAVIEVHSHPEGKRREVTVRWRSK